MAESRENALGIKPTLGLLGSSMNAMALIAPGAFLWITYQVQASASDVRLPRQRFGRLDEPVGTLDAEGGLLAAGRQSGGQLIGREIGLEQDGFGRRVDHRHVDGEPSRRLVGSASLIGGTTKAL